MFISYTARWQNFLGLGASKMERCFRFSCDSEKEKVPGIINVKHLVTSYVLKNKTLNPVEREGACDLWEKEASIYINQEVSASSRSTGAATAVQNCHTPVRKVLTTGIDLVTMTNNHQGSQVSAIIRTIWEEFIKERSTE